SGPAESTAGPHERAMVVSDEKTPDEREPAVPPPAEEDFASLLAASEAGAKPQRRVREGERVQGRVIEIGLDTAFVNIGAKAEAVLSLAEFRDPQSGEISLAVGDAVEATVTDDGQRSGTIVIKRTLGRGGHVPGELEQALAHGLAVEGVVT